MRMTGIKKDGGGAVDQVGVAIVFRVGLPDKGMEIVCDLHDANRDSSSPMTAIANRRLFKDEAVLSYPCAAF